MTELAEKRQEEDYQNRSCNASFCARKAEKIGENKPYEKENHPKEKHSFDIAKHCQQSVLLCRRGAIEASPSTLEIPISRYSQGRECEPVLSVLPEYRHYRQDTSSGWKCTIRIRYGRGRDKIP